ncbi:MAG: iron-containing alcohol dehydrogenase [Spirochaetes bacterium]|nr:iron-containing alcohol dehydrogenase [Spirochaetota bacterium]
MRNQSEYGFFFQPKIMSGIGALENIPLELNSFNAHHPFVITSKEISKRGLIKKFIKSLYDSNTTIGALYDDIPPYAGIGLVRELAQFYRDRGCDSIVAIGNDSVVVAAKAVNIIVSSGKDVLEFEGTNKIPTHLKPLVVVPTSNFAAFDLTNIFELENRMFISDFLYPDIIAIDDRMIRGCCRECMRAHSLVIFTQAVESYLSPNANYLTDAYASTALTLISENINKAIKRPRNKDRCRAIANAAVASAAAFSNLPSGPVHALGMAISKITGHHPGMCMGALLLPSLRLQKSQKWVARPELLLAICGADIYANTAESERAQKGYEALENLIASIPDIPKSLSDLKIYPPKAKEALSHAKKYAQTLKINDLEAIIDAAA